MARARKHRRSAKKATRKAAARHHTVKHAADKHAGHKVHTRTVNAPKAW